MSTNRDQLIALIEAQQADEQNAVRELASYLGSTDAKAFREKIEGFQARTMPNSYFDQIFTSILRVLDSTKEMADQTIQQAEAAAQVPVNVESTPASEPVAEEVPDITQTEE